MIDIILSDAGRINLVRKGGDNHRNSITAYDEISILRRLPETFLEFIGYVTLVIKIVSLLYTQQYASHPIRQAFLTELGVSVVRKKGNKM